MKPKTIAALTVGFVVAHFGAGLFFFFADISSANAVMAHYHQEVHGYPKDPLCIISDVLWFPLGPFSSVVWALPFAGALSFGAWLVERRKRKAQNETVV